MIMRILMIVVLGIALIALYLYIRGPDPLDEFNVIVSVTDDGELSIDSHREGMIHCRLKGVEWPKDGRIGAKIIDEMLQVANDGMIRYRLHENGEADIVYYRNKWLSMNEMVSQKIREYLADPAAGLGVGGKARIDR